MSETRRTTRDDVDDPDGFVPADDDDDDALADYLAENGVTDPDHPDVDVEVPGDWKVPLRWVDASDMPMKIVTADGAQETRQGLHDGESVWFVPTISMGTMFTTAGLALYGSDGTPEGNRRLVGYADDLFVLLAEAVGHHTLTGLDGRPWPPTRHADGSVNVQALRAASDDEIAWLLSKATGQEPEEVRKNALAASRSTIGARGRRHRKRR